jgi:hypothetical protein
LWKFMNIRRFAFKPSVRLCRCFHADYKPIVQRPDN